MTGAELDRLGDRLRLEVTPEDLTALDSYRRSFRSAYDAVVDRIRNELSLEVSGRPAKSTAAIVDKLRRSTMRLTQMQDIAGCRTVVSNVAHQSRLVGRLESMFDLAIIDRRARPSNGYRAVHAIVRDTGLPVEIQVRTDLQHAWAELSEKLADNFGIELKYGGGPPEVRKTLDDPPRQNSCRPDRTNNPGVGDEGRQWLDTDSFSRTGRWRSCCRRRARHWMWWRVK